MKARFVLPLTRSYRGNGLFPSTFACAEASTNSRATLSFNQAYRSLSSSKSSNANVDAQTKITDILTRQFKPTKILVKDTSGGCGAMFDIKLESPLFEGKTLVAQHKMVTHALKAEIKDMHGLTLSTKPSSS